MTMEKNWKNFFIAALYLLFKTLVKITIRRFISLQLQQQQSIKIAVFSLHQVIRFISPHLTVFMSYNAFENPILAVEFDHPVYLL